MSEIFQRPRKGEVTHPHPHKNARIRLGDVYEGNKLEVLFREIEGNTEHSKTYEETISYNGEWWNCEDEGVGVPKERTKYLFNFDYGEGNSINPQDFNHFNIGFISLIAVASEVFITNKTATEYFTVWWHGNNLEDIEELLNPREKHGSSGLKVEVHLKPDYQNKPIEELMMMEKRLWLMRILLSKKKVYWNNIPIIYDELDKHNFCGDVIQIKDLFIDKNPLFPIEGIIFAEVTNDARPKWLPEKNHLMLYSRGIFVGIIRPNWIRGDFHSIIAVNDVNGFLIPMLNTGKMNVKDLTQPNTPFGKAVSQYIQGFLSEEKPNESIEDFINEVARFFPLNSSFPQGKLRKRNIRKKYRWNKDKNGRRIKDIRSGNLNVTEINDGESGFFIPNIEYKEDKKIAMVLLNSKTGSPVNYPYLLQYLQDAQKSSSDYDKIFPWFSRLSSVKDADYFFKRREELCKQWKDEDDMMERALKSKKRIER